MNLLPIPALDGGRLVFLIIEAVRGKPIDKEKEGMVHMAGMMVLLALMVLILFNDVRKLFLTALSYIQKREVYMTRKDTKVIQIGDRVIGGGKPCPDSGPCAIPKPRMCTPRWSRSKGWSRPAATLSAWPCLPWKPPRAG